MIARGPQLDPDCLDALVAFADGLNLTAAAKALRRSQPTVHGQLKRLADAVGAPLYERRGRALALTEAGTAVLAYARESRERWSALEAALSKRRTELPVTLAAGEGALLYLLGPSIAAFRRETERAPKLLIGDREQTLDRVRSGLAQLGVTAITAHEASDLRVERVASVRSAIVAHKRHPLAARKRVRWEHLQGVALVLPPAPSGLRAAAHGALGPHLSVAIEARGWPLAMHCARLGLGVAIVNDFCEPPAGSVKRPLIDGPVQQYSLISRRDAVERDAVAALRRAIVAKVTP